MAEQQIELVKVPSARRYDAKAGHYVGEAFERGERAIMVDGIRWGRTRVTWHGMHGNSVTFQDASNEITDDNGRAITLRSQRKPWRSTAAAVAEGWKSTEDRTLEKVRELIAAGKLRHPDIVKAERVKAAAEYSARVAKQDRERKAAFRAKAMEALRVNSPDSEVIGRVVAAMEWAQTQ